MLLLALPFFAVLENGVAQSESSLKTAGKYVPHSPIFIGNNTDFVPANGVVSGNGTEENPYIIENWEIDASGMGYCICIENTTAHFVIQNCKLWNATDGTMPGDKFGILLRNVMNGTILNTDCSNNDVGIRIERSYDIIISNSACIRNYIIGIDIFEPGNNLRIEGNNCSQTLLGEGIIICETISNSSHATCTITNNICWENCGAMWLIGVENYTIASNNCSDRILLHYSNDTTIVNNFADGIVLAGSTNITVRNNSFRNYGITISGEYIDWITHTIENNTVCGKPIYYYKKQYSGGSVPSDAGQVILANCAHMNISNFNFTGTSIPIQLGFSCYTNITNNSCYNNSLDGIFLFCSSVMSTDIGNTVALGRNTTDTHMIALVVIPISKFWQ